jgi:dGTPase
MHLFLPFFPDGSDRVYPTRAYIERKLGEIVDDNQKVQYVRANWIGLMTEKLATVFMDNEATLLAGTLEKDLLKCLPETERKLIDDINKYSYKHIYNYRSVAEIEMAGYHVIGGLLRELVQAVLHPERTKSAKALKIIPAQFPISPRKEDVYQNVLSVVDFISGMTDLFALDLYRKMTGITIPDIR